MCKKKHYGTLECVTFLSAKVGLVEAVEAAKSQVRVYSTDHVFNLWYPLHKIYVL